MSEDRSLEKAYDPTVGAVRLHIVPEGGNVTQEGGTTPSEHVDKITGGLGRSSLTQTPPHQESLSRIAGYADLPTPTPPETTQPQKEVSPPTLPDPLRDAYSAALVSGSTTGPQDFAERYAGSVGASAQSVRVPSAPWGQTDQKTFGLELGQLAQHVQSALPTTEELIDTSIGLAHESGAGTDPETLAATRANMMQFWAYTHQNPADTERQGLNDAFLQEVMTHPDGIEPHRPTLEELKEARRDAIEPFGPTVEKIVDNLIDLGKEQSGLELSAPGGKKIAIPALVMGAIGPSPIGEGASITSAAVKAAADDIKPLMTRMEDDLNKIRNNGVADKVAALKLVQQLPPEMLEQKLQEHVSQEVEKRLADGRAARSDEAKEVLRALKPLTDEQLAVAKRVAALLKPEEAERAGINLKSVDQGYSHRTVKGKEQVGTFMDSLAHPEDVTTGKVGSGTKSLSTKASGMQARHDFYALQNGETRVWGSKPLDEMGLKLGDKYTDPMTGEKWDIKPATMQEIEKNTDIKYHKNFLGNTIDNVLRLKRIERNLQFLQQYKGELKDQGLFIPRGPDSGRIPEGWKQIDLPQMEGWANPRIANVLNDFAQRDPGDLDRFLIRANNAITRMLFASPIPHAANVGAHWGIGRGWEWFRPRGYYSLMADGTRALKAVWQLNDDYLTHLREGSGLMSASVETENFYRTMMHKLFNEQLGDEATWGDYARSLGLAGVKDLVKAEYKWSRQTLWRINDVFMLQRQFELMRHGLPLQEAIRQAERDIPNYRVPTEVMGSHGLSEFLTNGKFAMFGRYKYGMLKALSLMVDDLARGSAQERMDAIGKLTVLGALVFGLPAYIRPAGPLGLINNTLTGAQDAYNRAMYSLVTLGPVMDAAALFSYNFGKQVVQHGSSTAVQALQAAEAGIQVTYPGQLFMNFVKHGFKEGMEKNIGSALSLKLGPQYQQSSKSKHAQAAAAKRVEKKDTIEQWIKARWRRMTR